MNIYAALAGMSAEEVIREHAGAQFGSFKPALADLAVSVMAPITTEMNRLMQDPTEIDRILGEGATAPMPSPGRLSIRSMISWHDPYPR